MRISDWSSDVCSSDLAILVEHPLVAFDDDFEIALVLEVDPGRAIRQHIGVARLGGVECGAHALTDRLVPGALVLLDIDAGRLPELQLGAVREFGRASCRARLCTYV